MQVDIYHPDGHRDGQPGAWRQVATCDLAEVFDPRDDEREAARAGLERDGVYRGGGGAAPLYELRRATPDPAVPCTSAFPTDPVSGRIASPPDPQGAATLAGRDLPRDPRERTLGAIVRLLGERGYNDIDDATVVAQGGCPRLLRQDREAIIAEAQARYARLMAA